MTRLFTLIAIVITTATFAGDLNDELQNDLDRLDKKYVKAKLNILKGYKAKFEQAMKIATQKGYLDGALEIRAKVRNLEAQIAALTKTASTKPQPNVTNQSQPTASAAVKLESLKPDKGGATMKDGSIEYQAPPKKIAYMWTQKSYRAPVHIACLFTVKASTMRMTFGNYAFMCNREEFMLYKISDPSTKKSVKGCTPQGKPVLLEWHVEKDQQTIWMNGKKLYTVPWRTSRSSKLGLGSGGGKITVSGLEIYEYASKRPETQLTTTKQK